MVSGMEQRLAVLACIELVLMRKGNTNYNSVVAKLNSLYGCAVIDCFEHPDYLRTVIKQVYDGEYHSVIGEIKEQLDDLANVAEINNFLINLSNDSSNAS